MDVGVYLFRVTCLAIKSQSRWFLQTTRHTVLLTCSYQDATDAPKAIGGHTRLGATCRSTYWLPSSPLGTGKYGCACNENKIKHFACTYCRRRLAYCEPSRIKEKTQTNRELKKGRWPLSKISAPDFYNEILVSLIISNETSRIRQTKNIKEQWEIETCLACYFFLQNLDNSKKSY